jgi:acylphosphatase
MTGKTIRARVFGIVQGVCFRHYTRLKAEELGVSGWVKNMGDGSVEALIAGRPGGTVDEMVEWLHTGPPHAVVKSVRTTDDVEEPAANSFEIRR